VPSRIGDEDAAAVVDEHTVWLSELWRGLGGHCDRDE
jgi:hypothetical protein